MVFDIFGTVWVLLDVNDVFIIYIEVRGHCKVQVYMCPHLSRERGREREERDRYTYCGISAKKATCDLARVDSRQNRTQRQQTTVCELYLPV